MNLCQMDSTIIQTHRYFNSEWFQYGLHRFGRSTTLKTTKTNNQTHLLSPRSKNVHFDPPKGYLPLIFFQKNFIYIILGYRWVYMDTYIGHMTHLKNGHFSTGPPNIAGVVCFLLLRYVCVVFLWCVGGIGEVTPPLTLLSCLRYVGVLLGGDRNVLKNNCGM